jgi:hypothetical protein
MVKIETKAKLAKLLAMEDIDVEHRQVETAMFDVKSRCLILPTWKDMPNHLYDLLVGHEVGHALYTPADEETLKNIIQKTSKHCVNVVEDARIEALMKRRYPGLVKQFFTGYNHLLEKDFFGLSKMDVTRLNLLDKINLYFKVPTAVTGLFEFNDIEQSFVDRMEKLKKFDEVEKLCIDICEYIKENRKEQENDNSIFEEDSYTITDDGEMSDSETEENEGKAEKEISDEQDSEDSDDAEDSEESLDGEEENGVANSGSPDTWEETSRGDLHSETYENFENRVNDLADVDTENVYVTIPDKVIFDNLTDYKEVYKNITDYYSLDSYTIAKEGNHSDRYQGWYHSENEFTRLTETVFSDAKKTLADIKKNSVKNVNHMAMEFERKKCADIYKRTSFSKTGVLDTNKMFSAKYNDDIFKKNIKSPEGKNHGLIMIVDWSGSMAAHLSGCVKQVIEFVLFCKKVNIPFEVYSFTDVSVSDEQKKKTFVYKHGDLMCDSKVSFRNYFSSRMNARELNDAMLKICVITGSFKNGYQYYPIPEADRLGYTPLNGAVIFSEHVIRNFQKKNNLQEVHAVWITDGEGNNNYQVKKGLDFDTADRTICATRKNVIIQDKIMKKNYPINKYSRNITPHLLKIVKDRLGCNVVGFFLDVNYGKKYHMMNHVYKTGYHNSQVDRNEWLKKARKDGYFLKAEAGYDQYYVISNAPKDIKAVEMDDKMTNRKLASVFSSNNNQFKNSRVILSKFIDLITSRI